MFKRFAPAVAAVSTLAVAGVASAQINVTDAVTEIESVGTAITTVGVAVLGIAAVYMAYRWVKGFIKGG